MRPVIHSVKRICVTTTMLAPTLKGIGTDATKIEVRNGRQGAAQRALSKECRG